MESQVQHLQQTLLVVDDTPTNIQVLFDLLNASGYRVAIAKNGESALKRLQGNLPDLILLDIMMPGIDGFETCRRIKANEQTADIPIIFMTALSDPIDKVKGLKLGAVDYITKPIQHEEVLARIKVHLQLRQLNQTLEAQVAQRTAELTQALETLQQTQVHLVQSEKMSSLGQLVAGIAHEINNPINFIYGNLNPAATYTRDLLKLVQSFQAHMPDPPESLLALMEDIDLEFIQQDLPQLISSMKLGADRIRQIVLSLRNFSRLDESEFKAVDLHEGIESTLLILQHRLKQHDPNQPEIRIIRNYDTLPPVECYASQMNQVVMNILANAIDAMEEATKPSKVSNQPSGSPNQPLSNDEPPTIWLKTRRIGSQWVAIHIRDNGPGIPERYRQKIFDPFFTTKPTNKGTGLGMSISYQIVTEKHGGSLVCHSQPGQGAEFIITIPIHHSQPVSALSEAMALS